MRVVVVTPPEPLVDLDYVKMQLKISGTAEDDLIAGYIAAASENLDGPDGELQRAIGLQTLELRTEPCGKLKLPFRPIVTVNSVKYIDAAGAEQTLDDDQYVLRGDVLASVYGVTWPTPRAEPECLRIEYQAGYAQTPWPVVQAIVLIVSDWYRNRETVSVVQMSKVPMSKPVEALLERFQVYA